VIEEDSLRYNRVMEYLVVGQKPEVILKDCLFYFSKKTMVIISQLPQLSDFDNFVFSNDPQTIESYAMQKFDVTRKMLAFNFACETIFVLRKFLVNFTKELTIENILNDRQGILENSTCSALMYGFMAQFDSQEASLEKAQKKLRESSKEFFFLLNEESKAIAMVAFVRKFNNWVGVSYVYTDPEHRKKGYGRILMMFLETLAWDRKLNLFLHVEKNNTKAVSLYESLGYEKHSEFSRYSKRRRE